MMDILIVLEDNNGKIHRMGLESIAAAQKLANGMSLSMGALVMGANGDVLAEEASKYDVSEVLKINNEHLSSYSSDGYAETVKQVIEQENPTYVIFGHTYQVRDYAPKVSAKLMKPFLVDNVDVSTNEGNAVFTKQMFNAKLFSDVTPTGDGPYLISFQSAAFSSERGIGKEENIPLAVELSKALGGELAASRPVVDSGWLPSAHQIGSSGQSVSPKLYLALGISGAIQHVVGMKGSKNIVTINKDPDAPIFEISDYGVVGDILEIIPKLTEEIQALKN